MQPKIKYSHFSDKYVSIEAKKLKLKTLCTSRNNKNIVTSMAKVMVERQRGMNAPVRYGVITV